MRRLAAFILLFALGACSTIDDLAPVSPGSPKSVAMRAPRFEDSKPHTWESGAPWTYAVHGTDVSKYQTSVDWHQARASGISFAFVKATEGGDRVVAVGSHLAPLGDQAREIETCAIQRCDRLVDRLPYRRLNCREVECGVLRRLERLSVERDERVPHVVQEFVERLLSASEQLQGLDRAR